MKIIISPSKTQQIKVDSRYMSSEPEFSEEAQGINSALKKLDRAQLKSIYKASDKIVDEAYDSIQTFENAQSGQAIFSYTGAVFANMNVGELSEQQIGYLNDTLVILSAHYGALKSFDLIKAYRLDYKMKIENVDLKDVWSEKVNEYLAGETIINLASAEFSSMINVDMVDVEFKEKRGGKYKVVGTYAKMARGKMINMITKAQIENVDEIKDFVVDGYRYSGELSGERKYVFVK